MDYKKFYQENMYGTWHEKEDVTYDLLGEDPALSDPSKKPSNPFAPVGGELIKINVSKGGKKASFTVHAYIPDETARGSFKKRHLKSDAFTTSGEGIPFIICMHPLQPKEYLMENGIAVFFMESVAIATDDTRHLGAFYDLYPYGDDPCDQTGVLMAWAWGASKVLDAVYAGLDREFGLDPKASMVTGVSRWRKATAVCGAFDSRFRLSIPACSGAGGLALYNYFSEGRVYDFSAIGGPKQYKYEKNEPLDCLQSEAERGWFNDKFLSYKKPEEIPVDQYGLPVMAMSPDRAYFMIAAYTGEDWVNAPSMWECYKAADKVYAQNDLSDHLAIHFHLVGHAVLTEDAELFLKYFDKMYYGLPAIPDMRPFKTTLFAGQE